MAAESKRNNCSTKLIVTVNGLTRSTKLSPSLRWNLEQTLAADFRALGFTGTEAGGIDWTRSETRWPNFPTGGTDGSHCGQDYNSIIQTDREGGERGSQPPTSRPVSQWKRKRKRRTKRLKARAHLGPRDSDSSPNSEPTINQVNIWEKSKNASAAPARTPLTLCRKERICFRMQGESDDVGTFARDVNRVKCSCHSTIDSARSLTDQIVSWGVTRVSDEPFDEFSMNASVTFRGQFGSPHAARQRPIKMESLYYIMQVNILALVATGTVQPTYCVLPEPLAVRRDTPRRCEATERRVNSDSYSPPSRDNDSTLLRAITLVAVVMRG